MSESSEKKDKRSVSPVTSSSSEDEAPVFSRIRQKSSVLKPIRQVKKRSKLLDIPDATLPVDTKEKTKKKFDTSLDTNIININSRTANYEYKSAPTEPSTPNKPVVPQPSSDMSSTSNTAPRDGMDVDPPAAPKI